MGLEFKDKIMSYSFREMKCKQVFTTGILYYLYTALGSAVSMCISGQLVSESEFRCSDPTSFPGREECEPTFQYY